MSISIITPSYGQLDWLRLCVASVADQNAQGSESRVEGRGSRAALEIQSPAQSPLAIEHIIQDGGTPGIEEFARELGAEFYRDGKLVFGSRPSIDGTLLQQSRAALPGSLRSSTAPAPAGLVLDTRLYRLAIYSESDAGMYDAINKGMEKITGDLWAWLNSDEQYLPGTLAYVARWFEGHRDADILCGDALLTDDSGKALSYRRIVTPWWHHTRLVHLASLSCSSFYRHSIIGRVGGFDMSWRSVGDAEWMGRMMKEGIRIETCHKLLSTFAFTGQNTSESPLARKEAAVWRKGSDAPPGWMMLPTIGLHRFRKLFAGAYQRRDVSYAIHRRGEGRKEFRAEGIGWDWPSALSSLQSDASKLVPNAHVPYVDSTRVLGTSLMGTTYEDLSAILLEAGSRDKGALAIDFANTHVVTMRRHDPKFMNLTACIDLIAPDGMPLVWAMNAKGANLEDRVYGPTFTRRFLASCPGDKTHYLVGGSEECGRKFREQMLALNPSLNFVGGYHGRCSGDGELDDQKEVIADILDKRPDFIWVGLGTPKQYAWIHRIKPQLDHGVMLAVGFAFDVNAGMKSDAPLWMQRIGMTWLYRMATEPERLAGRYLKWNTLFLWYWAMECQAPRLRNLKHTLRNLLLSVVDLFASDLRDCVTGDSLGRGLILGWGGRPWVIGHESFPPLIPRFLPQFRLTYWKQSIGFTTHQRPDFPRLAGVAKSRSEEARVMNVVVTHLGESRMRSLLKNWEEVCAPEDLWIAFGGSRADFEAIDYPRKVFVEDPNLRKIDNQREKQSYTGIFQAMAQVVEKENPDFVYFCEYDHRPLVHDLNRRQVVEMLRENADVMGHWLYRVDGTSNYHMLYHETDPCFFPFWKSISLREDPGVILSMFGSGTMWSREAFLAVALRTQEIACYLEIYLPTLVHHLGFRVRGWNEEKHFLSNLPSARISVEEGQRQGAWTVHPIKEIS